MAIKKETFFESIDRYAFDFDMCKPSKGFAQLDTSEDASYYGNWVNFKDYKIVSYCEGDITIETCENKEEFKELLKKTVDFYKFNQENFKGIDLLCNETIKEDFNKLGLDKNYYLYKSYCEV
jgi:tRNA G10  N-methylase Trm11